MKFIAHLFRRSKSLITIAVLAGVLSGVCHAVLLTIVTRGAAQNQTTALVIGAFVGLCLLMAGTRMASQMLLARLAQDAIFDLRLTLCRRILRAPLRVLEKVGVARLHASLNNDVNVIGQAFGLFPILCTQAAVMVTCLIYLGYVSWIALLVTVGMLAMGMVGFKLLMRRTMKAWKNARGSQDAMLGHFNALTGGIKELKLHKDRRNSFMSNMVSLTAKEYRRENMVAIAYYSSAGGWGQMSHFALLGVIAIGLPQAGIIPFEAVVPALMVALYLISPLDILASNLPTLGNAKVALDTIQNLGLSLEGQSTESETAQAPARWNRIELDGITHSYKQEGEPNDFVLGPVNLSFRPGELVFIVGGNGSGKTTLAKLIAGLYSPESGAVRLDGKAVDDRSRDDYRQLFSMVATDFHLFDELIGLEGASLDANAMEYLRTLRLDSSVQVANGRFSTTKLSQGQRKRMALLTAYLENRSVYIFDEWAADQDPVFKRVFYQTLLPELRRNGKTVIAITHDDSYFHLADRVIKLNYGQIESDPSLAAPGRARPGVVSVDGGQRELALA